MNQKADTLIKGIKDQIVELNQQYLAEIQKNQELQKHQSILYQSIENQEAVIEQLNNQLQLLKMTNFANADNENQRDELKQTINEYIKEIDNCVQLLNR